MLGASLEEHWLEGNTQMTPKMLLFYFFILESGGTAACITRRLIKLYTYDMCACVHYASLKKNFSNIFLKPQETDLHMSWGTFSPFETSALINKANQILLAIDQTARHLQYVDIF